MNNLQEDLAASVARALDGTEDLYDGSWPSDYVHEYLDAAARLLGEYDITRGGNA